MILSALLRRATPASWRLAKRFRGKTCSAISQSALQIKNNSVGSESRLVGKALSKIELANKVAGDFDQSLNRLGYSRNRNTLDQHFWVGFKSALFPAWYQLFNLDYLGNARHFSASRRSPFKGIGTDTTEMAITAGFIVEDFDVIEHIGARQRQVQHE